MPNDHQHPTGYEDYPEVEIRDIQALTPPPSLSSVHAAENFATMSREFTAMVAAGTTTDSTTPNSDSPNPGRIGEEEEEGRVEENRLAIVAADINPIASPSRSNDHSNGVGAATAPMEEVSLHMVKKEEVVTKIVAWETAEIAKINNKFKREEVVLRGWESEQVENATALFKKVERKLEEKRARAAEKMQNEVAKAHGKAEEKRASAEGKRGTKVAKIKEMANLLRAVGRAPSKRSFF